MNSFSKEKLAEIRKDLEIALKMIGEDHGIEFNIGNIRFTPEEARFVNFSAKIVGAVTRKERKSDERLLQQMRTHNLVEKNAKGDTLVGYNTRRPRYPFSYHGADGRPYKCDLTFAKRLFSNTAPV